MSLNPRLVLGAQPSLDVRNKRLAFLGAQVAVHPLRPCRIEFSVHTGAPRAKINDVSRFRFWLETLLIGVTGGELE
jgi:hypothetical protein